MTLQQLRNRRRSDRHHMEDPQRILKRTQDHLTNGKIPKILDRQVKIKKIMCSSCKRDDSIKMFREMWVGFSTEFLTTGAEHREPHGYVKPGIPSHVIAVCHCGYEWRLKYAKSIVDVDI